MRNDPLSEARATVLDPQRVNLHPALMANAWATLKSARGQPIQRPELLLPAHVITTHPGSTFEDIGQACQRVAIKVRGMVAARAQGGVA